MEDILLVVIIIIVVYIFASGEYKRIAAMIAGGAPANVSIAEESDSDATADTPLVEIPTNRREMQEHLETVMINDGIQAANGTLASACDTSCHLANQSDFGKSSDFREWAISQSIDPRIIESNRKFQEERPSGARTGLTYSVDAHDTYDAVPWRGLSRPTAVKIHSPDQLPDIDTDRYPQSKRVVWSSGVSETE